MEESRMYEGYLRRGMEGIKDSVLIAGNFVKRSVEKHTIVKSRSDQLFSKGMDLERYWREGRKSSSECPVDKRGSKIAFYKHDGIIGFQLSLTLNETAVKEVGFWFEAGNKDEKGSLIAAKSSLRISDDYESKDLLLLENTEELRGLLHGMLNVLEQPVESAHGIKNATVLSELSYFGDIIRPAAA